jgi:hypothetical protein
MTKMAAIMTYHIHPKVARLQHEINTLERLMQNAQQRIGMSNPAILHNYREMIRARQDLIMMLEAKYSKRKNAYA